MNWYSHLIAFALGVSLTLLTIFLIGRGQQGQLGISDTSVVTRYERITKTDTVIKFLEKIVKKEVNPEQVYYQRVDTVFIERIKSYDFMLGLTKAGSRLRIFAYNSQDSILKESWYDGIGSNFSAFSATNRVVVKTQKFYWNRVNLTYSYFRNFDKWRHELALTTGVSYFDKVSLDAGVNYDTKDFMLVGKLNIRP